MITVKHIKTKPLPLEVKETQKMTLHLCLEATAWPRVASVYGIHWWRWWFSLDSGCLEAATQLSESLEPSWTNLQGFPALDHICVNLHLSETFTGAVEVAFSLKLKLAGRIQQKYTKIYLRKIINSFGWVALKIFETSTAVLWCTV